MCKCVNPFTPKLIIQILLTIQEQMYEWCSENWQFNQLSSEQAIKCQVLHTVWYISGERLKEKIMADHSCLLRAKSRKHKISTFLLSWWHPLISPLTEITLQKDNLVYCSFSSRSFVLFLVFRIIACAFSKQPPGINKINAVLFVRVVRCIYVEPL